MPGGYEWLIIIGVLLLLFGAKKLPDMARSVGQSARVFKGEMKGLKEDDKSTEADTKAPAAPQQVTEAPVVHDPTPAPAPAPAPAAQPAERPAAETPTQAPHDRTDVR